MLRFKNPRDNTHYFWFIYRFVNVNIYTGVECRFNVKVCIQYILVECIILIIVIFSQYLKEIWLHLSIYHFANVLFMEEHLFQYRLHFIFMLYILRYFFNFSFFIYYLQALNFFGTLKGIPGINVNFNLSRDRLNHISVFRYSRLLDFQEKFIHGQ